MEEGNHPTCGTQVRVGMFCAVTLLGLLSSMDMAKAETPASMKRLNVRRSRHLLVHSDLNGRESQKLLARLEAKLRIVSRYWAKPLRAPIECYVVKNTDYLPLAGNAKQDVAMLLHEIGGYADRDAAGKIRLIATDVPGVAEHELIHAYCLSAFKSAGPDWYREGMACYFSQRWNGRSKVHCDESTLKFLHGASYCSIQQIVDGTKFTDGIASSLKRAVRTDRNSGERVGWDSRGDRALDKALESYHWSWALCQFLASNKNYSGQFRKLGLAYLNGREPSFDDYFADNRKQLEAEFCEFATNVCDGYRVDLCRWDFELGNHSRLAPGETRSAKVQAGLGWQSSGVYVTGRTGYQLSSSGSWQTSRRSSKVSVARIDEASQPGALVAAVLQQGKLSAPFCVSSDTCVTPQQSGLLLFRCQDAWHSLDDNAGTVDVTVRCTN